MNLKSVLSYIKKLDARININLIAEQNSQSSDQDLNFIYYKLGRLHQFRWTHTSNNEDFVKSWDYYKSTRMLDPYLHLGNMAFIKGWTGSAINYWEAYRTATPYFDKVNDYIKTMLDQIGYLSDGSTLQTIPVPNNYQPDLEVSVPEIDFGDVRYWQTERIPGLLTNNSNTHVAATNVRLNIRKEFPYQDTFGFEFEEGIYSSDNSMWIAPGDSSVIWISFRSWTINTDYIGELNFKAFGGNGLQQEVSISLMGRGSL